MERWEGLIEGYQATPDSRNFGKVVEAAQVLLKEDVAPFEIDFLIETLLYKPVGLLEIASTKSNEHAWNKVVSDGFKLLSVIVTTFHTNIEPHFKRIIEVCQLPYDPQTRKHVLQCVASIARVSSLGAQNACRYIAALEQDNTCRAPLTLLVGTICEHHPEVLADEATRIWRIFLNILECNKNTVTIISATLHGLAGLFKNFGEDLPMMELGDFYEKLSNVFIHTNRCEEICLKILEQFANLFRERLSQDVRLRNHLWNSLSDEGGTRALHAVYVAVALHLGGERMKNIINKEILQYAESSRSLVKYTALRILSHLQDNLDIHVVILTDYVHIQMLEFELRNENLSYDTADAVACCIECNMPGSDKLLQTAVMFFTNIPDSKRKHIVTYGILKASKEIRTETITFLITETIQTSENEPSNLDKYLPLWKDLFDSNNGKNVVVLEKSRLIFEDFMAYVIFVLEKILDDHTEGTAFLAKFPSLFKLTSHILILQGPEHFTSEHCSVLLSLLVLFMSEFGSSAAIVAAARAACAHTEDIDERLYKMIRIDRCQDEALLCESCLALIEAPDGVLNNTNDVLMALQIVFSRNDVEPKTLTKALQQFESLLARERETLNEMTVIKTISFVDQRRKCKNLSSKEARILHRDILMFLGKYGDKQIEIANMNDVENTMILKLKDTLSFHIQNPSSGVNYKLNLRRILQLALIHENPNALYVLLVILCANPTIRTDPNVQYALSRVAYALSAAYVRGGEVSVHVVQSALIFCDNVECVRGLLVYLNDEKSPGVRKLLASALEELLSKDPGSESNEQLVKTVAEHANVMMSSDLSTSRRAGLDITRTLISALKENNLLTKHLLPEIVVSIARTNELDLDIAFDCATKVFLEKIELFDDDIFEEISKQLIEVLLKDKTEQNGRKKFNTEMLNETEMKTHKKAVILSLEFIKKIHDNKNESSTKQIDIFFNIYHKDSVKYEKYLYVLAELRRIFDLDVDTSRKVLISHGYKIINTLFELDVKTACDDSNNYTLVAIFNFLKEFCEVLLELRYQKTLQFLGVVLKNITAKSIKRVHQVLSACLSAYKKTWNNLPHILQLTFEIWCRKMPVREITQSIEKEVFLSEHAVVIFALKKVLDTFEFRDLAIILSDLKEYIEKWPRILMKLYSTDYIENYLTTKKAYLTDLLKVSFKFLSMTDIKGIILEGESLQGVSNENIGIRFCRYFMEAFFDILMKNSFISELDIPTYCALINDLVKFLIRKKTTDYQFDRVLEPVNLLWPTFELNSSFDQKHSLLVDLACLPKKLIAESRPLQWVLEMLNSQETSLNDKARLIGVLPGGEEFSPWYKSLAGSLPTRLSELPGNVLRSLMDALASNCDPTLLGILATLASGDESKGWWDEAMPSSMASILHIRPNDVTLLKYIYDRCWEGLSLGVCNRMLLPLLRYSTSSLCERFFSSIIRELLTKLSSQQRTPSVNYTYHKCVVDGARAFIILQVAFEKIPAESLESPSSVLYSSMNPPIAQSWYLVRETGKRCVSLRGKYVCPEGADQRLKTAVMSLQCANYNCLSAALCRRRPDDAKMYDYIFNVKEWSNLVDDAETYQLPIRHSWNQRMTRYPISIELQNRGDSSSSLTRSYTRTRTLRTQLFLRTLSENPLQFDLIDDITREVETQEFQLPDNPLNKHPCGVTLTAVISHASSLQSTDWRYNLVTALTGDWHQNMKWLLAQAICNCKEELQLHANTLRPALFAVLADTPCEENQKKLLNGLHIEILSILVQWAKESEPLSESSLKHLNTCVVYLICTCVEYRQRKNIYKYLTTLLGNVLDKYGGQVHISWTTFDDYLKEGNTEIEVTCHEILQIICKNKVYVSELLPNITKKLETKQWHQLPKMASLIGNALSACPSESVKRDFLTKYRVVLEKTKKSNTADYVKMLHYAQIGCNSCCDKNNFRAVTDLVPKIVSSEKGKCLQIISSYTSKINNRNEYVTDMFDTIDLSQLLLGDFIIEAMGVVKAGIHLMGDTLKRRTVMQMVDYSHHSVVKVRKAAYEVLLKAIEDQLNKKDIFSLAKKRKTDITSAILRTLDSDDILLKSILQCIGRGVSDCDENLSKIIKNGVAEYLSEDMAVRFAECFYISVFLTTTDISSSSKHTWNIFGSLSALLDMVFSELRSQERFKNMKLRDEPLDLSSATPAAQKLLTLSKTFQGTFRTYGSNAKRKRNVQNFENEPSVINVQMPIDDILASFLNFSKNNFEVSQAMCLELLKAILKQKHDTFDIESMMMNLVMEMMKHPNELTPLTIEIVRMMITVCGDDGRLLITAEELKNATLRSEGEQIAKMLFEEVKLRRAGRESFVLGYLNRESYEVTMKAEPQHFALEDLLTVFGKLSDWDNLTLQQKQTVQNSELPPIWTDYQHFKDCLDNWSGEEGWFGKMASLHRSGDKWSCVKRLREMDKWPRKHFECSAITEAILLRREHLSVEQLQKLPIHILPSDCLAEWAARLMIRKAFLISLENDSEEAECIGKLSRSHELRWCERANEIPLPAPVLQCIKRNSGQLYESETLACLCQKLLALRAQGLQRNDSTLLRKALSDADKFVAQQAQYSTFDVVVRSHTLKMQLQNDLNEVSKSDLTEVILKAKEYKDEISNSSAMTKRDRDALSSAIQIFATFCVQRCESYTDQDQEETLENVCELLVITNDLGLKFARDSLAVVLLKLLEVYKAVQLTDYHASLVLDTFQNIIDALDEFGIEHLKFLVNLFPAHILNKHSLMKATLEGNDSSLKYKQCMQLLCDPEHSLKQYIELLMRALKDENASEWVIIFDRIRNRIYGNLYAGSSYQLLNKYKSSLFQISEYEPTEQFKSKAESTLTGVYKILHNKGPQSMLRLSQLCPELVTLKGDREREEGRGLERLLALPLGVSVVKFEEKVMVFVDSIRRPTVFRTLLSDGSRRRYLHKSGECLKTDAAAQCVVRTAGRLWGEKGSIVPYNVTPLGDDCGLIEFLEDHERIRSLISSFCDVDDVLQTVMRPQDHELILSPKQASLQQFAQLCEKVPPYALRCAIEENTTSVQDFISKKRRFLNTLSSMTVLSWILGLGDRHLQNILYSVQDGGVCCVDWAAIFQFGSVLELPSVRLTRNLLAVCDTQVLESRIQKLLGLLREARHLFLPVVTNCFRDMEEAKSKIRYVQRILEGKCLSHEITMKVIESCEKLKHKDKYLLLMREVFQEFEQKECYSVEEQVSSLLRQSTAPHLLAVTRTGWEPWL